MSTDIPNATLKTRIVDGFNGIPVKPITHAVTKRGSKLGISDIIITLYDLNRYAMKIAIRRIANEREIKRFFIK